MKFRLPDAIRHIFDKTPPKRQVYVSLALTPSVVHGAVWSMSSEGAVDVLGVSSQSVPADSWDDRIKAADRIVTALEDVAGTQSLEEVVLGLSDEYLSAEGDIAADMRSPIKKLLTSLGLRALGYVPIATAIVFFLRRSEGIPPSCILLHVTRRDTTVSLYSVGQKIGAKTVKTSETIVHDIENAVKSVAGSEILPSRMLVYGLSGEDLEGFRRMLLKHPWTAKLQFLHFPKIEAVAPEMIATAVVTAGASELSHTVAPGDDEPEVPGAPDAAIPPVPAEDTTVAAKQVIEVVEDEDGEHPVSVVTPENPPEEEAEVEAETNEAGQPESVADAAPEDVPGFPEDSESENLPTESDVVAVDPETLGFSSTEIRRPVQAAMRITGGEVAVAGDEPESDEEATEEEEESPEKPPSVFSRLGQALTNLRPAGNGHRSDGGSTARLPLLVAGIAVAAIALAGAWYWFLPRATVTLVIAPKKIVKTATLTVDPSAGSVDTSKSTIPGKKIEKTENGEKTVATTGKKKIGTAAKGSVTIYNKSLSERTFKKGSQFTSGSLAFSLDSDVTVASASESIGSITFGKASGAVTAVQIGTEGNLPANSEFASKDLGSGVAIARNEQALTGGTSKDVTVVARADYDGILTALKAELVDKAKSELGSGVAGKQKLIDATVAVMPQIVKTYNRELDEEAKDVTGKVTVTVNGIAYDEDDIKAILTSAVQSDVPSGYTLNPSRSTVDISSAQVKKDGSIQVTGSMTGIALPDINERTLAGKTAGRGLSEVESVLRQVPGVGSVTIVFSNTPLKSRLPANAANIRFAVSVEQ
jgi:hypothetical protein